MGKRSGSGLAEVIMNICESESSVPISYQVGEGCVTMSAYTVNTRSSPGKFDIFGPCDGAEAEFQNLSCVC